ncbi:GAF domain-containing protein, partial [bacterium AH-315-N22]|nr:GAF domain-containing protein [bacterium AH-315-N22]
MTSVKNIHSLRQRLAHLRASWSVSGFQSLLTFYVEVLPKLMQVERCSIFLKERGGDLLLSRYGTEIEQNVIEAPLEGSVVGRVMATGASVIENDLHSKSGYHLEADEQTGFDSVNTLCIPITKTANEEILGVIQLLNTLDKKPFNDDHKKELQEIAEYLSISLESIILNEQILDLAKDLDGEVARLEFDSVRKGDFIAESPAMREVLDLVIILRDTPVNVLIHGENGTGKELVAKMIH